MSMLRDWRNWLVVVLAFGVAWLIHLAESSLTLQESRVVTVAEIRENGRRVVALAEEERCEREIDREFFAAVADYVIAAVDARLGKGDRGAVLDAMAAVGQARERLALAPTLCEQETLR